MGVFKRRERQRRWLASTFVGADCVKPHTTVRFDFDIVGLGADGITGRSSERLWLARIVVLMRM